MSYPKFTPLLSEESYHFQISSTAFDEYSLAFNKVLKAVEGFNQSSLPNHHNKIDEIRILYFESRLGINILFKDIRQPLYCEVISSNPSFTKINAKSIRMTPKTRTMST